VCVCVSLQIRASKKRRWCKTVWVSGHILDRSLVSSRRAGVFNSVYFQRGECSRCRAALQINRLVFIRDKIIHIQSGRVAATSPVLPGSPPGRRLCNRDSIDGHLNKNAQAEPHHFCHTVTISRRHFLCRDVSPGSFFADVGSQPH